MWSMSKNDLIEQLLNSDIEENRVFGTLLLSSEQIPEEENKKQLCYLWSHILHIYTFTPENMP